MQVYHDVEIEFGPKRPMTVREIRLASRRLEAQAKAAGYAPALQPEDEIDVVDDFETNLNPPVTLSFLERATTRLENLTGYIRTTFVYIRGMYHA